MKNTILAGILFVILGLFIALGPQTIFPVCGVHTSAAEETMGASSQSEMKMSSDNSAKKDEGSVSMGAMSSPMKCFWTGRIELGIGILISALGLLLILLKSKQARFGLSLAAGLNGILALLIPTVLIGVCGSAHMSCRSLALPALIIFSSLVILLSALNAVYLYITDKGGNSVHETLTTDDKTAVGI